MPTASPARRSPTVPAPSQVVRVAQIRDVTQIVQIPQRTKVRGIGSAPFEAFPTRLAEPLAGTCQLSAFETSCTSGDTTLPRG